MKKAWFLIFLSSALIFLALALVACSSETTPTSTPHPPTATPTPRVATLTPTPQPATPTPTPLAAPTALTSGPPPIPHTLAGRDNCLGCHETGVVGPKVPADHAGRTNDTCQLCHKPQ